MKLQSPTDVYLIWSISTPSSALNLASCSLLAFSQTLFTINFQINRAVKLKFHDMSSFCVGDFTVAPQKWLHSMVADIVELYQTSHLKMFFVMMAWQYYAETYCAEIVYILSRISS